MAINNYTQPNIFGFNNPYAYGFQPQSQTATPQQPQQNSPGSIMTIFVNSEEEMNNYPVAAGLTVLLICFNLKKFWLKTTDTSGVPQQPRSFSFTEETPVQNQNGSTVTRQEFDSLNAKIDKLINELGGIKNE